MKFLIIAPRFHTNLYFRAKALSDAGHTVKVLVLYKGQSEFYNNIDLQKIPTSFFSNIFKTILSVFIKSNLKSGIELRIQSPGKELKKIVKTFKPDVIILKAFQNMLSLKTLLIAKKYQITVLMLTQTTHTHIKGSKFLFKLNIKLFKFLKVHAYITPIQSNFEAFKKIGINNIFYLPFVFPVNKTIKYKIESSFKIISIGKYTKRKDHLLLMKAVNILIKKGFHIQLNIFGEIADKIYYNSLIDFIKKEKLEKKINIFTNIPYSEILNEYSKHNIFILPSYAEPASYSIVEAMANGLPVICSSENGTGCYIENGKTGSIFQARNLSDLVNKIELMISDKEKLGEISKNCLISAKENHNLESFVKNILNIIQK